MNYLIISSHPYSQSFNAAVALAVSDTLTHKGDNVTSINLADDGFNPVMSAEDLKLWSQGKSADPLVEKYQAALTAADFVIFTFPIWWGDVPAVLKGFCDKVLLSKFAYTYGDEGQMIGALHKKAVVISTMQTPVDVYKNYFNNAVEGSFIKCTLQTCGFDVVKYFQFDNISMGGRDYTDAKLKEIVDYFA